jgi:hypothetical protein
MQNRNGDLVGIFFWTVATLLIAFTVDRDSSVLTLGLRLLIATPLVFFLTGHTVLRAIGFAAPSLLAYIAYAVGASIAVCVAGGFVLNLVSSLTPIGWAVWFVFVTGTMTVIARQHNNGTEIVFPLPSPTLHRWHVVVLGCAASITVGAYLLALNDEARDREFKYTEFWMLPRGPGEVLIGIFNADEAPEKLAVNITADGEFVAEFKAIDVASGTTWTHTVFAPASAQKIEAKLYNDQGVYRKVSVARGE